MFVNRIELSRIINWIITLYALSHTTYMNVDISRYHYCVLSQMTDRWINWDVSSVVDFVHPASLDLFELLSPSSPQRSQPYDHVEQSWLSVDLQVRVPRSSTREGFRNGSAEGKARRHLCHLSRRHRSERPLEFIVTNRFNKIQ